MGIVVTIAMLLGLITLRPTPWNDKVRTPQSTTFTLISAISLMTCGAWNVVWYGLRHISEFWGWMAIGSGLVMMISALIIFAERHHLDFIDLSKIRTPVIAVLAVSFVLYAVTIVQINLGLPIIR